MPTHRSNHPPPVPAPRTARLVLLTGVLLGPAAALADDIQWSNTNGGVFSTGANWIGGVVPGTTDWARFGRTRPGNPQATYTVSCSTSPSTFGMVVEDDAVTLDLNSNLYALTLPGATAIQVGTTSGGTGRLTIMDGFVTTHQTATAQVGAGTNAPGFLTIGAGGRLLGPILRVGLGAPGTVTVQGGGDFVGGQTQVGYNFAGTATVTGAGSSLVAEGVFVGINTTGTLNVNAGGHVESTSGAVGYGLASTGTANVTGANSRWISSGDIEVGPTGQGFLNITSGGRVDSITGLCAFDPGSAATVNVSGGSQWMISDILNVSNTGQATMNVSGGGLVQSRRGTIAGQPGGVGTMTVDGVGSRWINSTDWMNVCQFGDRGTLNITGGGQVYSDGGAVAGGRGVGVVVVSGVGSAWTMTSRLSLGGDRGTIGGVASLAIRDGGTVTVDDISIYPGGTLIIDGGTLSSGFIDPAGGPGGSIGFRAGTLRCGTVGFALVNQGGTLAPGYLPGQPAGMASIIGQYIQQAGGTMEIEIGGTTAGLQFDRVALWSTGALGGRLRIGLINGFVPDSLQTFTILSSSGLSGAFSNAANGKRLGLFSGEGSFVVHYGPGSTFDPNLIVLSDFGPCPSDFNGDGFIDFFDYDAFVACFEGVFCPPGQDADFNDDGFGDFFDLAEYIEAFEAGC